MKRSIIFTTAITAAVGCFALGAAQAQGPAGKGPSAMGAQSGQIILPQKRENIKVQSQKRETNEYRKEYRNGEAEYDTPSNYRERAGEANQIRNQWKNMDEVSNGLRSEGYQIRKIEMERDGYEADVLNRDGRKLKLRLDPISGKVIGSELD
ncbi:PepSY domain-containing protein [Thioclava sp.]|uniref:PepSY domain-containing protein n=1 Tax=Thioclava sp. TaxID=1933450 RepID=UPI003AA9D157